MIPVTIFTGFLGSGKTTLINKIINQNPGIKFGFIINEFGEVGIDGELIEASENEIYALSNGCICCVVRKDLIDAVVSLSKRHDIDYLILESSGLAETFPIVMTFAIPSATNTILDSVICTIDCINFLNQSKNFKTIENQLRESNFVVLNKIEEISSQDKDKIIKSILTINPNVKIYENSENFSTSILIDSKYWDLDKLKKLEESNKSEQNSNEDENHDEEHEHEHHHHHEHEDFQEICFVTEKNTEFNKFIDFLNNNYPENAIRAKGFVNISTWYGGNSLYLFQGVGNYKNILPYRDDKKNSKTRLVFIGKDLDKDKIIKDLNKLYE